MNNRKNKIFLTAAILLLCVFGLAGCGKYVSKYKAIAFVHSNTSGSAFMSFLDFEGTMVFKLNNKKGADGQIVSSGKLETGKASIYYDSGNGKTELFSLSEGEEISTAHPLTENGTVYIIVQTDGKCHNGNLAFNLK